MGCSNITLRNFELREWTGKGGERKEVRKGMDGRRGNRQAEKGELCPSDFNYRATLYCGSVMPTFRSHGILG